MPAEHTAAAFGERMLLHLGEAEERNAAALDRVADRVFAAVRDGVRVHVTGTGHSTALVLETFYRAGGLACVNPITHPGLLPLSGGIASTALERSADLAVPMLAQAEPLDSEVAVVFSSSGVNPLPLALARGLREAGVWVVAVSALPHLRAAPSRAGLKLDEVADEPLDTGVPVGDAAFAVDGTRTAPLSSLTSIFLWNLVLSRTAERAHREGVDLPVWSSANTVDSDDRNAELLDQYRPRIPLL